MFWNKKLFEQAGLDGPPATMDDFMADVGEDLGARSGKYGYCLRGGTGGFNGYIMMMANMNGKGDYFDDDGNSTFNSPDAVKGLQFLVDLYQNGYAPKDSVNWGFNEIVAGFYSGTCAMLDQDPDALIAIAERMDSRGLRRGADAARAGRQGLPDHRLCRLVDVRRLPAQGRGLEADRASVVARVQPRMGQVRRRHPDPQGRRAGPGISRPSNTPAGSPS